MSEYGLERGAVELQSVGPIAFGPGDVLLVGDNGAASIVAIDVGDGGRADSGPADAFELDDLDGKLAALLSCRIDDVVIRDMAVHPRTHDVYLSVMRGTGDDSVALIVRVDHRDGTLSDLDLTRASVFVDFSRFLRVLYDFATSSLPSGRIVGS